MPAPAITILYVQDLAAAAARYASLLGTPPLEASPAFVLFAPEGGAMLGLWRRDTVAPAPPAGCGGELVFRLPDDAALEALAAAWSGQGLQIAQPIETAEFGRNLLALDADGHRLRALVPPE